MHQTVAAVLEGGTCSAQVAEKDLLRGGYGSTAMSVRKVGMNGVHLSVHLLAELRTAWRHLRGRSQVQRAAGANAWAAGQAAEGTGEVALGPATLETMRRCAPSFVPISNGSVYGRDSYLWYNIAVQQSQTKIQK